jgi:hypothetical protein
LASPTVNDTCTGEFTLENAFDEVELDDVEGCVAGRRSEGKREREIDVREREREREREERRRTQFFFSSSQAEPLSGIWNSTQYFRLIARQSGDVLFAVADSGARCSVDRFHIMVGTIDNDANVVVLTRRAASTLAYHGHVVDAGNRINFVDSTQDWFRVRSNATALTLVDIADPRFFARVLPLKGPNFEQVFGRALERNAVVVDENHWFRTFMRHQLEFLDADRILPIKSSLWPPSLRNVDFLNRLFFEWPSTSWTVAGAPNIMKNLLHHIASVCTWQLDPQLYSTPAEFDVMRLFDVIASKLSNDELKQWLRNRDKDGNIPLAIAIQKSNEVRFFFFKAIKQTNSKNRPPTVYYSTITIIVYLFTKTHNNRDSLSVGFQSFRPIHLRHVSSASTCHDKHCWRWRWMRQMNVCLICCGIRLISLARRH